MKKPTSVSNLFLASICGAVIGCTVAVLYAPNSGKKTRKKIRMGAETISVNVKNATSQLTGEISSAIADGGDNLGYRLGSAIAQSTHSSQELIQILEEKLLDLKNNAGKFEKNRRTKKTIIVEAGK